MKKILFFLILSNSILAQYSIPSQERDALIALHQTTNGEYWSTKWDLTKDPRQWYGIKIKNGHIKEINLAGNALKGNFPNLSAFKNLENLDLSSNLLTGNVGATLSSLSNLKRLDLSKNNLNGDPSSILSSLTNLEEISIGSNQFSINNMEFFLQNFTKVRILDLSKLELTSVPQKLSTYNELTSLNLSQNKITNGYGILSGLGTLLQLDLSGNNLTTIPSELGSIPTLRSLNLSNNLFTSNFSSPLSSMTQLEWISLEGNEIQNLPQEIANLTQLIHLNLGRNKLSNINSLSSLKKLEQLYLNNNNFSGEIPSSILNLPRLQMLSLTGNNFSGNIPNNLPSLTFIENNRFTKNQIKDHLDQGEKMADFIYSPQRYDEPTELSAIIGNSISLPQSLSGNDYQFIWFKNLDQNTNTHTENYYISNVQAEDYTTYTAEAYFLKEYPSYVLEVSLFREPITLKQNLGTKDPISFLNIYPNPTKDYLYISTNNHNIKDATVYDQSGKQLMKTEKLVIDVRHLPSGIYLIQISFNDQIKTFKWIKE